MRKLFLGVLFLLASTNIFAMSGAFGTEVFTDEDGSQYSINKVVLYPQWSIWKIDIGLDLQLYFDSEGDFIDDNWDSSSDIIKKILYLKYGDKGDTLYVKFGSLSSATIGHGIIFNRYSNMVRYPEIVKRSLVLDINLEQMGIETLATSLERSEVYGGRFYFKPFYNSGSLFLANLKLALSGGTDVDPDSNDKTKGDAVSIGAADMELPLVDGYLLSSTLFGDIAQMDLSEAYVKKTPERPKPSKNNGSGSAVGFFGKLLVFDYQVQYKSLDNNFVYSYFDSYYEIEKSTKAMNISDKSTPKQEGWGGTIGFSLMDKAYVMASYEDLNNDTFDLYPWVHAEVSLDKSLFMDKVFFKASYDKKNASNWDEVRDLKSGNALVTTELGIALSDSTTVVISKKYTYDIYGNRTKRTKFETRIIF